MNSKQKRTLASVFKDPVSASMVWKDIESLLIDLTLKKKQSPTK
jgi:hypothetical protein